MNRHIRLKATVAAGIGLAVCAAVSADPLPDSFTYAGVTLYATIDVGYAYQTNGAPLGSKIPGGLEYQSFTTTRNFSGSQSTIAESGLEQSKVGIRIDVPVGFDFNAVGRLETGFNPLSGELANGCASIADNSGDLAPSKQTSNADSSRCGQPFNGPAYGGISNKQFGTLTIGRQQSLQLDALATFDPQTLSYAFSFLGYSGFDGGAGSTEALRWDNSAKYVLSYGPVRGAAMYSSGGQDTGIFGRAYGAELGVTLYGLQVDGVWEQENGAVNLRSANDNPVNPLPTPGLATYISNDRSWNIMGKYTFDFGGEPTGKSPGNKLILFAGYSNIQKSHSNYDYGTSQGDYPIDIDININSPAKYNLEWVGAKYTMPAGWSFTGAYYHTTQNSWTIGLTPTGTQGIGCVNAGLLCSGKFEEASVAVDYAFSKRYDAYVGVNWSEVTNGLASGFPGVGSNGNAGSENQTTFMIGYRIKL